MMRFKSWAVWAIPMKRVSRFWRDVRCERIGGGTDEIMIYVAGRQILKDYQNKYLRAAQLNKTAPPDLSGKTLLVEEIQIDFLFRKIQVLNCLR